MRPDVTRRLCVPAFLAVSAVAPGCGDDGKTTASAGTTNQTTTDATTASATGTSTTGATGTTSAPTTGAPTTGAPTTGNTGTDTGTETGGLPNCEMYAAERPCEAEAQCYWFPDVNQCIVDCTQITDQATCNTQDFCAFIDGACQIVIV